MKRIVAGFLLVVGIVLIVVNIWSMWWPGHDNELMIMSHIVASAFLGGWVAKAAEIVIGRKHDD